MKRFVPGVDSYLATGIPPSLMRFSDPASDTVTSRHPSAIDDVALIVENATSLSETFRNLCYWRQIVNAENN
jgi:hypothetical protein